jgi:ribosomal protein S14
MLALLILHLRCLTTHRYPSQPSIVLVVSSEVQLELVTGTEAFREQLPGWQGSWDTGGMFQVEIYGRVRRAVRVEGKSQRAVARDFGLSRDTVRKMLQYAVPPGYQRTPPPSAPRGRRGSFATLQSPFFRAPHS